MSDYEEQETTDTNATEEVGEAEDPTRNLGFAQARVLGVLLEKEATTPDYYPMTQNAIQTACNQKSNRDPVSEFDDRTVEDALTELRAKHFAVMLRLSGSRAPKYKHTIDRVFNFDEAQKAVLCVLMLRGVQTAGELNQRTERIHHFGGVPAVEQTLESLINYSAGALVCRFPAGSGRRVETYGHLLSGEPELSRVALSGSAGAAPSAQQIVLEEEASWRKKMEDEIGSLRQQVATLRDTLESFRQQFE